MARGELRARRHRVRRVLRADGRRRGRAASRRPEDGLAPARRRRRSGPRLRSTRSSSTCSRTASYRLAPEVFGRGGAIAVAALIMVPLAALVPLRRWSAFVLGGSLAVLAVTLTSALFPTLRRPRLDLAGAARSRLRAVRVRLRRRADRARRRCCAGSCCRSRSSRGSCCSSPSRATSATGSRAAALRTSPGRRCSAARSRSGSPRSSAGPAIHERAERLAALAAVLFVFPVGVHAATHWTTPPRDTSKNLTAGAPARIAGADGQARRRLLRRGHELPDRRVPARLRGECAAAARGRHDREPPVRALRRRGRVPQDRRPRDPAPLRRQLDRHQPQPLQDARCSRHPSGPTGSTRSTGRSARSPRDHVLAARGRRRRAAAAEDRHLPARARDRDARARAGRLEVDPPRRGAAAAEPGLGAPRPLRRAACAQAGRGAARDAGARAARDAGEPRVPPRARPGRERDVERDCDSCGDPDRAAGGHRRGDHDVAARLRAPRRRGGEEGDGREVGRRPARLARRSSAPQRRERSSCA